MFWMACIISELFWSLVFHLGFGVSTVKMSESETKWNGRWHFTQPYYLTSDFSLSFLYVYVNCGVFSLSFSIFPTVIQMIYIFRYLQIHQGNGILSAFALCLLCFSFGSIIINYVRVNINYSAPLLIWGGSRISHFKHFTV